MKPTVLLIVAVPAVLAAQTPNPARLAGDWDFTQGGSARQTMAFVHLPADSAGGELRMRFGGRVAARFTGTRLVGDSAFLDLAPAVVIAGVVRGDSIIGNIVQGGRVGDRIRMARRATPGRPGEMHRLWAGTVSDSAYAFTVDTAVPMRARDGTLLMSMVVRPVGDGPFPVILVRTPYGRLGQRGSAVTAAVRGYIFVAQDVRGRYGSEGEFRDLIGQDVDGYDAVEWAAALPGSNGKVGMIGGSYEGWTQWYAAVAQPPHLAAIVPIVSPPDPWLNIPYWNMVFSLADVYWACLVSGKTNQDISGLDTERGAFHLPVRSLPQRLGCQTMGYWDDWTRNTTLNDFWRGIGYQSRIPNVRVPVLGISGWHDDDGNGTTTNWVHLARVPDAPFQRMVLGPWSHRGRPDLLHGEFPDHAWVDQRMLALRWFDRWLKGIDNGVDREPPIDLYIMGDNVWRSEREWPLARTRWTRYYLHSRGAANTTAGDGTLDTLAPRAERADTFTYDPGDPTPYLVDPRELELNLNEDYRALHAQRRDVLVYTTAPLERDVEVTGPLAVTLWAATDARDTDWHAMLLDVYPDGRALRVQDGIARARFRQGFDREVFPARNQATQYTIDLWHTGMVFKAGHRIRVTIASAAFPKYARNLNTGGDNNADSTFVRARQRVLHDRAHPSYITLPVIPR